MPNVNPREKGKPFSNSSFRSSFDPAKFQGGRKILSLSSSAEKKRNEEAIESLNSVTETKRRGMKTRRDNANKEEGRRGMKRLEAGWKTWERYAPRRGEGVRGQPLRLVSGYTLSFTCPPHFGKLEFTSPRLIVEVWYDTLTVRAFSETGGGRGGWDLCVRGMNKTFSRDS